MSNFPSREKLVENPHLEKELNYPDADHAIAHGHNNQMTRSLTVSLNTSTFKTFNSERKRRTSTDEMHSKPRAFLINVEETKKELLEQEDADKDFQITVSDYGPKTFALGTVDSGGYRKFEIRGHYMLANLLQELAIASEHNRRYIVIQEARLNENPVHRMHRLIKYHYWDGLVRSQQRPRAERVVKAKESY